MGGCSEAPDNRPDPSRPPAVVAYEQARTVYELACEAQAALAAGKETDQVILANAETAVRRAAAAYTTARAELFVVEEPLVNTRLDGHRAVNIATGMLMDRLAITPADALALLVEASISSCRTLADVALSYVEAR